jgi:cell cycle protein
MNIIRPFVDMFWKNDILNLCATFNLKYALDYTNELDLYSRNKVRNRLKKLSEADKEKMYLNYVEENSKNALLETQILKLYEE